MHGTFTLTPEVEANGETPSSTATGLLVQQRDTRLRARRPRVTRLLSIKPDQQEGGGLPVRASHSCVGTG